SCLNLPGMIIFFKISGSEWKRELIGIYENMNVVFIQQINTRKYNLIFDRLLVHCLSKMKYSTRNNQQSIFNDEYLNADLYNSDLRKIKCSLPGRNRQIHEFKSLRNLPCIFTNPSLQKQHAVCNKPPGKMAVRIFQPSFLILPGQKFSCNRNMRLIY